MSHLKLCFDDDVRLRRMYRPEPPARGDSGYDLRVPKQTPVAGFSTVTIDHGIRAKVVADDGTPLPFYVYPRSSMGLGPVRMSNCVGIIDAGYRGTIKVCMDNIRGQTHRVCAGESLVQLCTHNLLPFKSVEFVAELDDTVRGRAGFGSTGMAGM